MELSSGPRLAPGPRGRLNELVRLAGAGRASAACPSRPKDSPPDGPGATLTREGARLGSAVGAVLLDRPPILLRETSGRCPHAEIEVKLFRRSGPSNVVGRRRR